MFERNGQRTVERQTGEPRGGRLLFGSGLDPRECGSRGGQASALSRKLRKQRELEAKVTQSKSGYANLALLRIRREDEAALLRERFRLDTVVCRLMDEQDQERAELALLKQQTDGVRDEQLRLIVERTELYRERDLLHECLKSDAGLDAWLQELGEERVEAAAARLGWIEEEADGAVA